MPSETREEEKKPKSGGPPQGDLSPDQRQRKIRLERGAIATLAVAFLVLTLIQREVIDLGAGLSDSQGLVALVSINVSVLLMTVLILLILRHLYRIFFETQGYGSLQTKMVVAFICLSLVPSLLIFYYSYRQLVRGHDLWFSPQIEEALHDSIDLTEAVLAMDDHFLASHGGDILEEFKPSLKGQALADFLENGRRRFHLTCVEFYGSGGQLVARGGQNNLPPIYHDWFDRQLGSGLPWVNTVETDAGDLTRLIWPLFPPSTQKDEAPTGYLAIGRLTLAPIRSQMEDVRQALINYQDALTVQRPFKVTQLTALTAMSMLAVFICVWIGSHLARSLSRPVLDLVGGTKRVAAGDWDFQLSSQDQSGEFAELVKSFNSMTRDLKDMYVELDSRRRFVETVLKNVSTGVVILGPDGRPLHINQAAEGILFGESSGPEKPAPAVSDFRQFGPGEEVSLPPALLAVAGEMIQTPRTGRRALERHVRLNQGEEFLSLKISLAALRNEEGVDLGYLLAFDDLTELEKAQRLAAWREVARRIAHEVKNPLTPIQLSAQRLRRRFSERLSGEGDAAIFQECTEVIIRQVEEMKKLVDEFSQFARLPEIKPRPGDFALFVEESLALFRQAHKKVTFEFQVENRPPIFSFDPEQMRRVLTNILDNAVTAMNEEGSVFLTLSADELTGLRLTISDTGPGLESGVRDTLFDPHVTTKSGGQGLGLAIVRTIISDHGGFIRAKSLPGEGARFIIELPLRP